MLSDQTEKLLDKLIRLRVSLRSLDGHLEPVAVDGRISSNLVAEVSDSEREILTALGSNAACDGRLIPITAGTTPSIYTMHSAQGSVSEYRYVARRIVPKHAVFGFQHTPGELAGSLGRLSRRYAEVVQRREHDADFVLYGGSAGGLLALEMTHLLTKVGRKPKLLILLDTRDPDRHTLTLNGDLTWYGWISLVDTHCGRRWLSLITKESEFWKLSSEDKLAWMVKHLGEKFRAPWSTYEQLSILHKDFIEYWQGAQNLALTTPECPVLYVRASQTSLEKWAYMKAILSRGELTTVELACHHLDLLRPSGAAAVAAVVSEKLCQLNAN